MFSENDVTTAFWDFVAEKTGASFTEYALLGSLAAVVCLIALLALSQGGA